MSDLPKYRLTRVASSAAIAAVPGRVMAVLLCPADAKSLFKLTNDANGSGDSVVNVQAVAEGASTFVDFTSLGGVMFTSKIYATIAGSGAIAYVWWM